MSAPRLDIDLDKIQHNARTLVDQLARRGISVGGVTKAALGSPEVARALLRGGVTELCDSRVENVETMRAAGVSADMWLIRSPMLSQARRVVEHVDISFNTELAVLSGLSAAAQEAGKTHGVVLMIELGDLREGLLRGDVEGAVAQVLRLPKLRLSGLGANLACRSGVAPGPRNMAELSEIADTIEAVFGIELEIITGGNSANLDWALGAGSTGRINQLRLGEAILLGRQPLTRLPIEGLYTDAFTLSAEVIEAKLKPSIPWGDDIELAAFGTAPAAVDRGPIWQTILSLGRQDTDPAGLHSTSGVDVLGASSDHLITHQSSSKLAVGAEVSFQLNYGALLAAMTSPFVAKVPVVARAPAVAKTVGSTLLALPPEAIES